MEKEYGHLSSAWSKATPDGNIIGFHEKKADAPTMPGDPDARLRLDGQLHLLDRLLVRELLADEERKDSSHDFGQRHTAAADRPGRDVRLRFSDEHHSRRPDRAPQYWRDVGTLDAYYEASMDLRSVSPALNLYNRQWPLRTAGYFDAPAKFVFDEDGRRGHGDRLDYRRQLHHFRRHASAGRCWGAECAYTRERK